MDGLVPNSQCPYINNIFCCFCGDAVSASPHSYRASKKKMIPGKTLKADLKDILISKKSNQRAWAYLCYNPWYRKAEQPEPAPVPKSPNPKAKRGNPRPADGSRRPGSDDGNTTPNHVGHPRPADGSRRPGSDDGRPKRPWICESNWLFLNYGIGKPKPRGGWEVGS